MTKDEKKQVVDEVDYEHFLYSNSNLDWTILFPHDSPPLFGTVIFQNSIIPVNARNAVRTGLNALALAICRYYGR